MFYFSLTSPRSYNRYKFCPNYNTALTKLWIFSPYNDNKMLWGSWFNLCLYLDEVKHLQLHFPATCLFHQFVMSVHSPSIVFPMIFPFSVFFLVPSPFPIFNSVANIFPHLWYVFLFNIFDELKNLNFNIFK